MILVKLAAFRTIDDEFVSLRKSEKFKGRLLNIPSFHCTITRISYTRKNITA